MKTVALLAGNLAGKLLPEGRLKDSLRKQYLRHLYNPLYPLKNIVRNVERTQNDIVLLELTNGIKLYGPSDKISDKIFDPAIRYGDPSKLGKICNFEDFYSFFYVVCEQYVHDVYHKMHRLTKGDVVLDLGAHIGAYSVKAALAVGPEGKVIAIEPNQANSRLLRANIKINGLRNVTVLQRGVWRTEGKLRLRMSNTRRAHSFCVNLSDFTDTGEFEEVEVGTVDNILRELRIGSPTFIKMDIEGAELEAIDGMNETLHTSGLKLAIAAYHRREGIETHKTISKQLNKMGLHVHLREGLIYAQSL